jgi:hypothetical protein
LIPNSSLKSKQKKLPQYSRRNAIPNINLSTIHPSDLQMNLLDETNPNILQMRLAQMMANASASSVGHNNDDSMMNTLANIQRNFLLKLLSDPMAAAQAAQVAAAVSASQIKANNISPISSNNKQSGSGRKRKSPPEKRVITNHRSNNNNTNNDDVEKELVLF